jgi:hypothetical protein
MTENGEQRTDDRRLALPLPANAPRDAQSETLCIGHALEALAARAASTIRPPISVFCPPIGGARRDRTDDLMLAKHALSQLSYGPLREQKTDDRARMRSHSVLCRLFSVV